MDANASAMGWPDELVELLVVGGHRVIRYDHRDFAAYPYGFADLARGRGRRARGLPTPPHPRVMKKAMNMLTAAATDREAELDRRVAVWRMLSGDAFPFGPEEERAIDHAGHSPRLSPTPWPRRRRWREAPSWAGPPPRRW